MCTRFVYNGDKTIVGFNFDIDLSVWTHTVIAEKDRFFIGIKMPDNRYHSFHGINRNGNVGTLLYVNGNKNGEYCDGEGYITVADLTESYIRGEILFEDALKRYGVIAHVICRLPNAHQLKKRGSVGGNIYFLVPLGDHLCFAQKHIRNASIYIRSTAFARPSYALLLSLHSVTRQEAAK